MSHTFLFALALVLTAPAVRAADPVVTYDKDVRPIFRKHCQGCHNPDRPRGELDLSSYAAAMQGGTSGKAVVAGKSAESLLSNVTAHLEEPKMPPGKPRLPQQDLDVIKKWIDGGLKEKAAGTAVATPPPTPPAGLTAPVPLRRPTAITALAASPTAPLAAFPGHKQVLVWDLSAGKLLGALPFPEGEVHCLRFSRDGKLLLAGGGVGGESGRVVGFEVATWKRLFEIGEESDAVLACDVSPDGSLVVLGGPTRAVKIYSVADGKPVHTFRKPTDWVTAAAFSPEGLLVAAGDRFGGLFVWEVKSGKEFAVLRGHTKGVTSLAWRADSDAMATASEDGTVRVWDLHKLTEAARWTAHESGVLDISWHSSGALATGGRDRRVRLWDQDGKLMSESDPATDDVMRVAIVANGKEVLSGDWSGELRLGSADGKQATTIARPLAPSGSQAAVVLPDPPAPLVATITPPERPNSSASVLEAQQAAEAAMKDLRAAQAAHEEAKKTLAIKSAAAGLAQLRLALALEPDNPSLARAVAEAEAAVKSLGGTGPRPHSSASPR